MFINRDFIVLNIMFSFFLDPSEVYAWGSNFNYNLGLGNVQSRAVPEILEVFRKDTINIKQVILSAEEKDTLTVIL